MSYYVAGYIQSGYFEGEETEADVVTPADSASPATVSSSNAVQTFRASAEGSVGGATVTSTVATAGHGGFVQPADSDSGSSVTASSATQTLPASPASCFAGALVTQSRALVLNREITYPVAVYPDTLQSAEYQGQ